MTPQPVLLQFDRWPAIDRDAWDALFRPGDVLEGCGEAVHWAEGTRRANRKHYARWLGWLACRGKLHVTASPAARATPDEVRAYASGLIDRVAPRTAASSLIGLKCVLKRMDPEQDWRWLMDLTNRLDSWALPTLAEARRILPAQELFLGAMRELKRLAALRPLQPRDRLVYRDVLIVALLAACPIRLRNLTQIRIGQHLHRVGGEWRLSFAASETKTHTPLQYVIPPALALWLEFYLDEVRPRFRMPEGCDKAWPGGKGHALASHTLYQRIRLTTARLFGTPINPHGFRSSAATTLAEHSAATALFARPLLGHTSPATTERHYIRANQAEASRRINATLLAIRGAPQRRQP